MATSQDIIVIYNADSSIRGKITYAYRKLSSSSAKNPACAACDITHGGLSLSEVPGWKKTKTALQDQGWTVLQWHRDEVETSVKQWTQDQGLRYPLVISRQNDNLQLVADSSELTTCAGDATKLLDLLKDKSVIPGSAQPSL